MLDDYGMIRHTHVYSDVHVERSRAHGLHDDHGQSMERKTWDDPRWLGVVVEEVLESVQERVTNYAQPNVAMLRNELVQSAAMICAWIDSIDATWEER